MKIYWEYHTEKYTKKKKEHINHLWYISYIEATTVDFGFEAEIDRIDDGVFSVIFYKGEPNEIMIKNKTMRTFKTLATAKKAVKAYMQKGVDSYITKMLAVKKGISTLACSDE